MIESCDELGIDSVRNGDPRRIVPSQASVSLLPRSAMVTKKKKNRFVKKKNKRIRFCCCFFLPSFFSFIFFRHFPTFSDIFPIFTFLRSFSVLHNNSFRFSGCMYACWICGSICPWILVSIIIKFDAVCFAHTRSAAPTIIAVCGFRAVSSVLCAPLRPQQQHSTSCYYVPT